MCKWALSELLGRVMRGRSSQPRPHGTRGSLMKTVFLSWIPSAPITCSRFERIEALAWSHSHKGFIRKRRIILSYYGLRWSEWPSLMALSAGLLRHYIRYLVTLMHSSVAKRDLLFFFPHRLIFYSFLAYVWTQTKTHTHTHTQTPIQTQIQTHTHTQTQTLPSISSRCDIQSGGLAANYSGCN